MKEEEIGTIITALPGWCTETKARILFSLIISEAPELSIELGVFGGRSLLPIAFGHKETGHGIVMGVDAWRQTASVEGLNDKANDEWWSNLDYDDIYASCLDSIKQFGLDDIVILCRAKSMMVNKFIQDDSVGFIHQDSNHSQEITCNEVEAFWPKLKKGGIWVSDDTNWPTVQMSLRMLENLGAVRLSVIDSEDKMQQFTVWKKA